MKSKKQVPLLHDEAINEALHAGLQQQINISLPDNLGLLEVRIDGVHSAVSISFSADDLPMDVSRWSVISARFLEVNRTSVCLISLNSLADLSIFIIVVNLALSIIARSEPNMGVALAKALKILRNGTQLEEQADEKSIVGTLGELQLLQQVASNLDWESAIKSWRQKANADHDFSFRNCDVEVKVTRKQARIHRISSLYQLQANPRRSLFMLSFHITEADVKAEDSFSFSEVVIAIRKDIDAQGAVLLAMFDERLKLALRGLDLELALAAEVSNRQFRNRSVTRLIRVDRTFPQITPLTLKSTDVARLAEVEYDVDVTGLGVESPLTALDIKNWSMANG
jgi:Putative  PD-(D/E)XK family member, (DUF4420)